MPSPYSYDLRVRALKMIDEGIPITQVRPPSYEVQHHSTLSRH
ncbi:hypothetical protein PsalMR5_00719 [Piscirickettsia salmonis]|nr:hypothetical protein [Piscirickettsia salmonis]QGP53313.1 hypothetical protein PsalSR1_00721 [Piscirickettsia salmonis]QGP60766.1 hypothetical protein PsalBI1_03387 [Piscirickettsia salmonis]QGP62878.1 hypothetical protein PsalMR5_00719 [Piscirickettsia salmonis]